MIVVLRYVPLYAVANIMIMSWEIYAFDPTCIYSAILQCTLCKDGDSRAAIMAGVLCWERLSCSLYSDSRECFVATQDWQFSAVVFCTFAPIVDVIWRWLNSIGCEWWAYVTSPTVGLKFVFSLYYLQAACESLYVACIAAAGWHSKWPSTPYDRHMHKYKVTLTPSTPVVPHCCCSKGPASITCTIYIFDIQAFWRSVVSASAPMSTIKNSGQDQ